MGKYDDAIGGGKLILDVEEVLNEESAKKVDDRIKKQKAELEKPIEINVKSSKAEKRLQDLTRAAKQVKNDLQEALSSNKSFEDVNRLVSKYQTLKKNIKEVTPEVDKNNKALAESAKVLKDTKKIVDQLTVSQDKLNKTRKTKSNTSAKEEVKITKELVDVTKQVIDTHEKAAKTTLRTQAQINTELDKEKQKLKEIEEQEKRNDAARERFKRKQENYGKIALGTDKAVIDVDKLNYATQELKDFNTELEKRNQFQEKYNRLCKIVEKSFIGQHGAAGMMWDNMDQFIAGNKAMKSLEQLSKEGIKGWSTKQINGWFKEVVNSLKQEMRMTQRLLSDESIVSAHVEKDLDTEEIKLNQEMQSLLEVRETQLKKINALREEEISLIKQAGQAEAKVIEAAKTKPKSSKVKVREFVNMDEYLAHQDKYRDEHDGENEYLEDVVDIVPRIGKDFSQISADMTTSCKKAETAIKRFFSAIDPNKYPELAEWKAGIEETMENGVLALSDKQGGWAWEVQALDNDKWYVSLISVADAQSVVIQQAEEMQKKLLQTNAAPTKIDVIDEDELEIIKKENGALEEKLELLQEIAEQYANTVTQKNREKYEELNQKDMDGGLTSRQEERFWELGEAIDEADRQIDEFGQTYNRVILKLANGKKIEILPDDAGLRKFDKIANEYYGGEYNGVEIEDVIFERVQAVTGAILEQKEATEKLAEARLKLSPKKDGNYTIPETYTALDGKYEVSKGKDGWDVYQRDSAGMYNLIGTYKTLQDVRNDTSLLAREEIVVTSDVTKEVEKLAAAYEELSTSAGYSAEFAEQYLKVFNEVRNGALSAADAIKQLNEAISNSPSSKQTATVESKAEVDTSVDKAKLEERIKDLKYLVSNHNAWIKYLDRALNTDNFKTSGKREATEQLKNLTYSLVRHRNEDYENYNGQYAKEMLAVSWMHGYQEAQRQKVAKSTLDRYHISDAEWDYDKHFATLKQERDEREVSLKEDTEELKLIEAQIAALEKQKDVVEQVADVQKKLESADGTFLVEENKKLESSYENLTETVFNALKQIRELENQLRDNNYSDNSAKDKVEKMREIHAAIYDIDSKQFPYISEAFEDENFNPTGITVEFSTTNEMLREMAESIAAYVTTSKEELGELKLIKIDTSGVELFNSELKNISDNSGKALEAYRGLASEAKSNNIFTLDHHSGATWFSTQQDVASGYTRGSDSLYRANLQARRLLDIDANHSVWNDITFLGDGSDDVSKKITELYEKKQELKAETTRLAEANQFESQSYKDVNAALRRVTADYEYYSNSLDSPYGTHDTNWYAKYAQKNGYDAVRVKNVYDTLQGGGLSDVIGVFFEEQILNVEKVINAQVDATDAAVESNKKLTSSYQGLAAAVEQYVDSSKKLWSAYDKHEDFSKFAEDRNAAIKKIASFFPAGEYGISDYLEQSGYSMYLQSQESSRSYAQQGAEAMLADVEKHLGILEEERAAYKERQSKDEKLIAQKAEEAARAKKEQAKAAQEAAAATEKQAGAESKVSNNVSVEELIKRDIDNALAQLRSAKNNETTLFTLKGVFEGEDLVDQAQAMIQNIAEQANLSLASFNVKDDTIKVKLYNDELKVTVDQMYKLRQATEDMESAQLELVSQSFTQNVKALNENNFDTEGIQQRALASIEKVRSSLHGLEYDLTDLEIAAKKISSQDDFTKFNNQLKAAQDNIQAIKNATVSKSSMNPLANMQRDMQNASIEIETMRLKLEKFGDIQGVTEARQMLEGMTTAAEQYNKAADAQGQQSAYNQYSNLRSSFKAQTEYINAAKALNESQKSDEKKVDPIRQQYQAILDLINKINTKSAEITKYQNKDGSSGIFAGHISQLQAEKAKLVSELQGITDEINNALGGGFVQGKEVSVPFASILDGSGAISSFLNDTKTQASLTTEEIDKLVVALQKSQNLDMNAATKVTEQFKSVQETYKRLSELTGVDQSNESYQALGGLYRQIIEYKDKLSADHASPMSWTPEESNHLQTLIDQFTKYGNKLAEVAEKEAKYFAGKTKYSQDTTMNNMAQNATEEAQKLSDVQQKLEEAARKFAQESGAGNAFITNFTQGADGISKLDFSVFDSATGSLRNFRMEMGSVTEGMFVTETTISKSLANIKAAQKQLQSVSGLLGKLDASGVSIDESTATAQVSKLLNLYKQLSAEIAKGDAADQNKITKLTSDLKIASSQTEKFYKQMIQMEDAIASGKAMDLGMGDPKGNVYGQLVNEANKLASAQQNVTVETGRFDATTNTLNASLVHANGTIENIQLSMNGLNGQMTAQQAGVTKLTDSWDRFKVGVAKAGKHLMTALVGYNTFFKVVSEVRKGIGYVKEIDLALTELKKVTDETEESYRKFLDTAAGMAGEIGSTVSDFTEASANFARLGYTMEESANMAKTAIVYKNVADGLDTVEESTDSIISTMKAFGIESDNTMRIIDVFNEVGNNFAITSAGIGEAMQRSASALFSAGNTFEESTALITAANSVIQNPEQVGTALKTLALRLRGAKVELEEAGLETDNMAESTSTLQKKLEALTHGKVDIMLDADTFKSTTQILREMSDAWQDMTDIERASALELMGGKRQANILSSLISNFETVEQVIETSMNSSGSAIEENLKWMDSIEGKSTQLSNNMQTIWNNTLNSDWIKWFYDLAIGATDLVKEMGLIPPALAAIGIYFTAFKKNNPLTIFKDMTLHMQSYQQALAKMQALKSFNLNVGTPGNFDASSVNAYATAVAGLTAKKQAEMLATSGLNKMQIAEIMRRNQVNEAVIQETLSKMNLKNTTQSLSAATVAEAISTDMATDKTQEKAIADFLAANGSKKLTLELVQQAVAQGVLTAEQAAGIIANNKLALSWKMLGASIKTAFMSNPVGIILTIITSVISLVSWLGNLTDATEKSAEAAQEALSSYKEAQSTLREQKATIDEISDSYTRLSKGVNLDTNENISLTTSSYEEYLNICNDIADMYPHLVTGFDAQGNAILSLKGDVDALTQAYRDASQAARQQMIAGGSDIFNTFKSNYDSENFWGAKETGIKQQKELAKQIADVVSSGTDEDIIDLINPMLTLKASDKKGSVSHSDLKDLMKSAGIETFYSYDWLNMKYDIDVDKLRQQLSLLQSYIKTSTTEINAETAKVKSLMDAYLGEDPNYAALSNKNRAMVDQIVSSLDAEFINSFDSAGTLYNWISTNVVSAFHDKSVTDAINELSKLQLEFVEGDISYSDYITQLNDNISKIQNKVDGDTLAQIKIGVGIDEESLQTSINHIYELIGSTDVRDPRRLQVSSLSVEDIQIAGQLEVPEGTILSWDELTEKIEQAHIAATQDFDITNYTDAITAHSAAITEYQEALQSLDKGSFTMNDFMELIKKYPELAKGVDISSNAFHGLSRNLKGAIKTSTKSFVKDLKELRAELVAAGKSTDSIDQLIDAINNMPENALGNIIKQYSTLTDKIESARRAQDKLLASMDENPNEGYETRGEAMEYMKEAMKKGEIGSESNLWNVAEKYGFTYDSAKTINENADALAKYIAIREKWFQEEDDGDNRTNDGYSYKGTESFIKDVESAVKKSAELQQLLTWDYDESTGTLNFDYDNKDWDTIVSILSKTKELAGLTSDEFADMMIQIGQYFGINWGNYDDILDHLNGIATSSSDAKTKVEEYGQVMQEYFGEDTTIDLTARPMVSGSEMIKAGWTNVEEDSHATVFTSTISNKDGTKSIVVTPILPNGTVLSPEELDEYANKLLAGEEIDPDVNIKLAEFDGANSIQKANEYAQALHEVQEEYDTLRDTLNINTTIDEKGIEGLKEIKEIQSSIGDKSDGTIAINEGSFREALEGAQYAEDQIDLIIDKIKKLNNEAFIKFDVSKTLEEKGIDGLKEINELQGAIKQDTKTGFTIVDTDMFTEVLEEAGYTKEQIKQLIDKIKEYQSIVAVSGNTDPLGLNNTSVSIESLKASLSTLGVKFDTSLGKWFDGKTDFNINVQDMVSALKAKGWTDEAVRAYMTQLANTNIGEEFKINVKTEQIDAALEKANEVPEEKETEFEITGDGLKTLKDIKKATDAIPKEIKTTYTTEEVTVKKTKTEGNLWDKLFGSNDDDNTKYENKRGGSGTVFAGGTDGAPRTETALVGELGPELLVRNGRWTTIGDNGAEFTQVKKGDIIFNHKQTESLLKNGYITSRGKAYAGGTAYADTSGTFAWYNFGGTGGYNKYDVNNNIVESWGDVSGIVEEAEDASEEFSKTLDWIEIRLEEINEQMDLLEAKVENAASASDKNALIDQMLALNETKLKNLKAGAEAYEAYADTLFNKIPSQYQEMARDGSISITQFAGEADEATVEAIENYREWTQKAADLNLQIEELKKNNADLARQKFDNVADEYERKIDLIDKQNDKIDAQISLMEDRGYVASENYYNALIGGTVSKGAKLLAERARLQAKLDSAVRNNDITKGDANWDEMVVQIYDVDLALMECTADIEEYKNAINDIKWDNFDELIDRIDYLSDETQNLIDLMEDSGDVVDENGKWTDEGITSLGLYAQQMEIAEYRAKQYEGAIDDLNKGYRMGLYSESEYQEKLNELKDAQYDSIEAYYEAQDAIVDLNKTRVDAIKDGIDKEIEAYEELIDAKKEELEAEKD